MLLQRELAAPPGRFRLSCQPACLAAQQVLTTWAALDHPTFERLMAPLRQWVSEAATFETLAREVAERELTAELLRESGTLDDALRELQCRTEQAFKTSASPAFALGELRAISRALNDLCHVSLPAEVLHVKEPVLKSPPSIGAVTIRWEAWELSLTGMIVVAAVATVLAAVSVWIARTHIGDVLLHDPAQLEQNGAR